MNDYNNNNNPKSCKIHGKMKTVYNVADKNRTNLTLEVSRS